MNKYIIYCDGASRNNPGAAGWGAVMIKNKSFIKEIGGGFTKATNNQMELLAATKALQIIQQTPNTTIDIYCDSQYVIRGICLWIKGWINNKWKTSSGKAVENIDYWKNLYSIIQENLTENKITWHYTPAHTGIAGNERADMIAGAFADNNPPALFSGRLEDYKFIKNEKNITPSKEQLIVKKKKSTNKKPAYSYVSQVGGIVKTHKSWDECKKRVLGQSKAKFKKSLNYEDEQNIIATWISNK